MIKKLVDMYKKRNPIAYARSIGVKVGEHCKFVDNPIWGTEPYLIRIGNHVLISCNVTFVNHDGATWVFRETPDYKNVYKFGKITIGDNCFIGCNSTILPGVILEKTV